MRTRMEKLSTAEKLFRQAIEKDQKDSLDPGQITFDASDAFLRFIGTLNRTFRPMRLRSIASAISTNDNSQLTSLTFVNWFKTPSVSIWSMKWMIVGRNF